MSTVIYRGRCRTPPPGLTPEEEEAFHDKEIEHLLEEMADYVRVRCTSVGMQDYFAKFELVGLPCTEAEPTN